MKLFAARLRTRDYDDMVARWPDCGFDSAEQAVEPYRAAYPHEAEDPTRSTALGRAQEQQPSPVRPSQRRSARTRSRHDVELRDR